MWSFVQGILFAHGQQSKFTKVRYVLVRKRGSLTRKKMKRSLSISRRDVSIAGLEPATHLLELLLGHHALHAVYVDDKGEGIDHRLDDRGVECSSL